VNRYNAWLTVEKYVDETKAASECECMSSASVSTFKYEIFSYEMRQYCKSRRAVMELKV